ncbi:MAG TPA: hypothetical protein PKK05_05720, partial [Leptospiraceae bacterium]|nr:hypothetical protein [Leptospiraceae bacterium]
FLLQEMNPIFSIYVLKKTAFYGQSVWQSGIVYDVLLGAGFILALLLRSSLKNILTSKIFLFLVLLNVLLSVPVFSIDFTKSFQYENFIKSSLITGILKPLACFGIFTVFIRFGGFREFPSLKLSHILLAAVLIFGISRIVWGSPVPKLEDELAYYIQALIYSKGQTVQKIMPPDGISLERIRDIMQIPYIIFDGDLYYSAHYHGWSLLLALFNKMHLISFAGITVSIAISAVFFLILKELYPDDSEMSFIGMTVLFSTPSFIFLSSTYMSHSFTLLLNSLIFYVWLKGKKNPKHLLLLFLLVPAVLITRIQSSAAFFSALIISDLTEIILQKKSFKDILYLRTVSLFFSVLLGAGAVCFYYTQFPAGKILLTDHYFSQFLAKNCQSLGIGENHGCFPTYGTLGHSLRKMALINLEELYSLNSVASPAGIPLLSIIIYSFWKIKKSFILWKNEYTLLLVTLSQIGIYGLYWHNGGESYQGRYLLDGLFAFMILGTSALKFILKDYGRTPALLLLAFSLFDIYFIKIRGEFINPFIEPITDIQRIGNGKTENCLFNGKTASLQNRTFETVSEFNGSKSFFTLRQTKSFLNTGNVNMFALSETIDEKGFFKDRFGNSFVWDSEYNENEMILSALNLTSLCTLKFREPEFHKGKWMKQITFPKPLMEKNRP